MRNRTCKQFLQVALCAAVMLAATGCSLLQQDQRTLIWLKPNGEVKIAIEGYQPGNHAVRGKTGTSSAAYGVDKSDSYELAGKALDAYMKKNYPDLFVK